MKKIIISFFFLTSLVSAQSTYQTHIINTFYNNLPGKVKQELNRKDTVVYKLNGHTIKIYRRHYKPGKYLFAVKIFKPEFYRFLKKEILHLVEREVAYFLFLPGKEWNEYSKTEKIFFTTTNNSPATKQDIIDVIKSLKSVHVTQAGNHFNIEIENTASKKIIIAFPSSYTFITGLDRIKLQEELLSKIYNYKYKGIAFDKDTARLKKRGDLYVKNGKNFIIPQLNSTVYYDKNKKLIYNPTQYPRESLTNLLLTDLSDKYDTNFKVYYNSYKGKQQFEISLKKILGYFSNGFEKYFGIEEFHDDSVRGTLIIKHPDFSYIHLLDIHYTPDKKNNKAEKLTAYFYAFIPQNEIKEFFGTDKNTKQ